MLCAIAFMMGLESGQQFFLRAAPCVANGAITRKALSKNRSRFLTPRSASNAGIAPAKLVVRIARPGRGKQ